MAARLLKKGKAIDVLVNNAGALINPREETAEGLEKSFALLLLSPYELTSRLHRCSRRRPVSMASLVSSTYFRAHVHSEDPRRRPAEQERFLLRVSRLCARKARPDDPD